MFMEYLTYALLLIASRLTESTQPKPEKAILNLTTQIDHLRFNDNGEMLAMSSMNKVTLARDMYRMYSNPTFPIRMRQSNWFTCRVVQSIRTFQVNINISTRSTVLAGVLVVDTLEWATTRVLLIFTEYITIKIINKMVYIWIVLST